MNREKAERYLKISLFGALLTLIGAWRPIMGGLIGFVGICMEFCGLMTLYPLIQEDMPRSGRFYKFAMYVYLAVGVELCIYHAAFSCGSTNPLRRLRIQ